MNGKHFAALCTILVGLLLAGCAAAAPTDAVDTPQATAAVAGDAATSTPTQTEGTSLRRPTTPLPISPSIATLPPDAGKVGPNGQEPKGEMSAALLHTGDAIALNPMVLKADVVEVTNGQDGETRTLTADQAKELNDLLAGWTFLPAAVDAEATPAAGWLWSVSYTDADGNTTLSLALADPNTLVAGDARVTLSSQQCVALAALLPTLFDAAK